LKVPEKFQLAELRSNSGSRWFESLTTGGSSLRLFCFPYAGGNAHVFREWQRHLGPEIDVCLVHLPGRARRIAERPRARLRPLVEEMADAIGSELRGQFAFYGHSMGALICFELARELRHRNWSMPIGLFLSACRAPGIVRGVRRTFDLPVQELMAEIRKLNGTPKEFFESPEIQNVLLPLLRADLEIIDTYEYVAEAPLACAIKVYGGERDTHAPPDSLVAWELQTSAKCTLQTFSGDHFFIQSQKMEFLRSLREDALQTLWVAANCLEQGSGKHL
jgi:medium-chain acyl-[acyl-carrier-protein] hydrolase